MSEDGNFWFNYWHTKNSGGHREKASTFLDKEGEEKLFHLLKNKPNRILDFGCGSLEITKYFSPHLEDIIAVDFSKTMLAEAQKTIEKLGIENIKLIHASTTDMWQQLDRPFDVITGGQVIQYLDFIQLREFLNFSKQYLNNQGRVIFFDVIDPRKYFIYRAGWFSPDWHKLSVGSKVLRSLISFARHILRTIRFNGDEIGYTYYFEDISNLGKDLGFKQVEIIWSSYYEYRYHVILSV